MASPGKASIAVTAERLTRTAVGLFALGALSVGVSGLVAEAMGRLWGAGFVAGDRVASFPAERCEALEAAHPGTSCLEAAALDRWADLVHHRVELGVLGLLALVVFVLTRRWGAALPRAVVPGTACLGFGAYAVWMGWQTVLATESGTVGVGAPLSAAVVALGGALACGVEVLHRVDIGG